MSTASCDQPQCDHAVRYIGRATSSGDTCAQCGMTVRAVVYLDRPTPKKIVDAALAKRGGGE